jgi:hypothetical protein
MTISRALRRPLPVLLGAVTSCLLAACGTTSPAVGVANTSPVVRPASSPVTAAADSGSTAAGTTAASHARAAKPGPPERGVDIDFYYGNLGPGNTVANESPEYVNYVKQLGANWVQITFPVFEAGRNSSVVGRGKATPSPYVLNILVRAAKAAGLAIELRPLLDETTLGASRVHWQPANLAQWFASYQRLLIPYVQLAQRDHVQVFTIGSELEDFAGSPRWNRLDSVIRRIYSGRLQFDNTWNKLPTPGTSYGGTGVREAVDAYPGFQLPDSASVRVLTNHWAGYDRRLPAGTVLTEVGIAAQPGMYKHPYVWRDSGRIEYYIQVKWFTAACNAVINEHMGGIFFWSVPFGSSLTVPSGLANPGAWAATPSVRAIAQCFSRLKTTK